VAGSERFTIPKQGKQGFDSSVMLTARNLQKQRNTRVLNNHNGIKSVQKVLVYFLLEELERWKLAAGSLEFFCETVSSSSSLAWSPKMAHSRRAILFLLIKRGCRLLWGVLNLGAQALVKTFCWLLCTSLACMLLKIIQTIFPRNKKKETCHGLRLVNTTGKKVYNCNPSDPKKGSHHRMTKLAFHDIYIYPVRYDRSRIKHY
jgi:hypothetical protein